MRLNSDSGPIFIFVCIVVGILFYGKVHEFSVWINLDMDSTWKLLGGAVAAIMAFSVAVKYMGISPIKVFPWLPLIMTPFCFGALRYWSVDHLGDMVLDSSPQWYGTTFGMLAILAAEAGLAYGINRLTERR